MRRGVETRRSGAGATALLLGVALTALIAAAALIAAGCDMPSTGGLGQVGGSGVLVTKHYDYTGFTKVVVDGGFSVAIDYGTSPDLSVTVDDNLVKEHLKVELDGDTLHIGLAPLWRYHDVTLRARVVMPRLTGLDASGASTVVVTKFGSGDPLQLKASGASEVHLVLQRVGVVALDVSGAARVDGGAQMDELTGSLSGAGEIALTGAAQTLKLDASGASAIDLAGLTVGDADVTLTGGTDAEVLVTGTLNVSASGGSSLGYSGDPKLGTVEVSGGAEVKAAAN
jgi:hypothetical protein